jgi:hypothetical protein
MCPQKDGGKLEEELRNAVEEARKQFEASTGSAREVASAKYMQALERFEGLILDGTMPQDVKTL